MNGMRIAGLARYGCVLGAGAALGYEWRRQTTKNMDMDRQEGVVAINN